MLAAGLSIEECVETIAAILPVDSMRGVDFWRMLISLLDIWTSFLSRPWPA